MRTADHMNLSRYIMDHMDAGASKLKKAAFIFGKDRAGYQYVDLFQGQRSMARRSLEDTTMKMSKSIWKNLQINSQRNLKKAEWEL